jgi:hypothetical protein
MTVNGSESLRQFVLEWNRLLGLTELVRTKVLVDIREDLAQLTGNVPAEASARCPRLTSWMRSARSKRATATTFS